MKTQNTFYLIAVPSLFTGCTSVRTVSLNEKAIMRNQINIEKFNARVHDKNVIIAMKDGRSISADQILLRADSTSYINTSDTSVTVIPTNDIHSFEHRDHLLGGIQGVTFGGLLGAAIGGGTFYLSAKLQNESEDAIWYGIIYGGMIGGMSGLVFGVLDGSTEVYELQ